mmetsp:Transcript_34851/g.93110  ORF Transcript_34851/g.93110 Transcript_34851/m.93110 type:complete len:552 (+) Transcript_34851:563-2218(+)
MAARRLKAYSGSCTPRRSSDTRCRRMGRTHALCASAAARLLLCVWVSEGARARSCIASSHPLRPPYDLAIQAPPVQHAAGVKAAKLLQHHKLCRHARNAACVTDEPQFCLVCSLVARARMQSGRDLDADFKLDYSMSPYDLDNPPTDQLALAPPANHGHNTRRRKRPRANTWDGSSSGQPNGQSNGHVRTKRVGGGQRVRSNSESSEEGDMAASSSSSSSLSHKSNGHFNGPLRRRSSSIEPKRRVVRDDMRLSEESLAAFKTLTQAAQIAESEDQRASVREGASLLSTLGSALRDRGAKRARAASWGGEYRSSSSSDHYTPYTAPIGDFGFGNFSTKPTTATSKPMANDVGAPAPAADSRFTTPPINGLAGPPIPEADSWALPVAVVVLPTSVEQAVAVSYTNHRDRDRDRAADGGEGSSGGDAIEPMEISVETALSRGPPASDAAATPLTKTGSPYSPSKDRSSSVGGETSKPSVQRTPHSSAMATDGAHKKSAMHDDAVLSLMRLAEAVQAISPPSSSETVGHGQPPSSPPKVASSPSVASPTAIKAW